MRRAFEFHVRKHRVRVVYVKNWYGGMYDPHLLIFLTGPNGSINGVGPKPWPRAWCWIVQRLYKSPWLKRRDITDYTVRERLTLHVSLPHLPWWRAYTLRRLGGLRLHNLIYRLYP